MQIDPLIPFTSISPFDRVNVVKTMLSATRRRVTWLEKGGLLPPSLDALDRYLTALERSGAADTSDLRKIKVTSNFNEQEQLYYTLGKWLNLDTSSTAGARKWEKNVTEGIAHAMGKDPKAYRSMSDAEKKRFWEIYRKVAEDPRFVNWQGTQGRTGSGDIIARFLDILTRKTKGGKGFERTDESLLESLERATNRAYLRGDHSKNATSPYTLL